MAYPLKATASHDSIQNLRHQQATFVNPGRIIFDRGAAFTSKKFKDYCDHITVTTGVPRSSGQVER